VRGAIILPHVAGYPEDQIEVLAVEHLRSYLGVGDGDTVALRFPEPELD
jgi:CTP-dependent riboflavin kinase